MMGHALPDDQFTEILVDSDEQGLPIVRDGENVLVRNGGSFLRNG
jgi:hypothetical protein